MGKSERQQTEKMVQNNNARINQEGSETRSFLQGELPGAAATAKSTYDASSGAYKSALGGTGAYDPDQYNEISDQIRKNTTTGGYNDAAQLDKLRGDINKNVDTGGYDQSSIDKIRSQYEGLTAGGLGGINAGSADTIRKGYTDISDPHSVGAEAQRRQAASNVSGIYSTLGANLSRRQAATGFSAGGGETAMLARQMASKSAEAVTGAESEIGRQRIAGLGGLSQFETGAAAGQRAAVAGGANVEADIAGGRRVGTSQEADLAKSQQQGVLQSTQAAKDLATGVATQHIQAAGGLAALYNSSPGYVTELVRGIMQNQQITGQLTTEQAQIMQELSKQPGLFGNIMNFLKTAGGAAAGVMGGIGAMG